MRIKKRHTCIICNKKRYQSFMVNVFSQSWACRVNRYTTACSDHSDIETIKKIQRLSATLKILNVRYSS